MNWWGDDGLIWVVMGAVVYWGLIWVLMKAMGA